MNVDLAERERRGESTYKNSNTPWTTLLQDVQTPVITPHTTQPFRADRRGEIGDGEGGSLSNLINKIF